MSSKAKIRNLRRKQADRTNLVFDGFDGALDLDFAGGEGSNPKVTITAYNGGKMKPRGYGYDVVVDLSELAVPSGPVPLLRDHDRSRILGHADAKVGRNIQAAGELSGQDEEVNEVVKMARKGFPWRVSIGADGRLVYVESGVKTKVNGETLEGPFYILKQGRLQEISILAVAADMSSSARISAQANQGALQMDEELGQPAGEVNAGGGQATTQERPAAPVIDVNAIVAQVEAAAADKLTASILGQIERRDRIREICAGHDDILAKAVAERWTVEAAENAVLKAELEAVRASRPTGVAIHAAGGSTSDRNVIAASILLASGVMSGDALVKEYGEKAVEEAGSRKNRNYGLKRLMHEVLATSGKSCPIGAEDNDFIREVFTAESKIQASGAASSLSLTYVLQDVANKGMLAAFNRPASIVPQCFGVRNAKDFKTLHNVRIEGEGILEEIGADGEIRHASMTDGEFTVALKTFAKMLGINRKMMINDDLGAFMRVSAALGDMAYKAHEKAAIETMITPGGSFYGAGNSASGGGTALSMDSFTQAYNLFAAQTDTEGYPITVDPAILLVPKVLELAADRIVNSEYVVSGNTTAAPQKNQVYGKARVLATPWLSNAKVTSATATRWFLLANPSELTSFVVAYLNGQRNPTIESSDLDFNKLGMQFRIFWDFNFGVENTQGVVKMAGA